MVIGTPRSRARSAIVPKRAMMSEAVITQPYDNCRVAVNRATNCVVEAGYDSIKSEAVFDTDELLSRLEQRGVRNIEIAKVLGLPDSRVPEIRRKARALKLDEAAKLVRAFGLEQDQEAQPLPLPILRLAVAHISRRLGVALREEQVADLAEDLRAFSVFAANPKVRGSIEAAEGFFQALQIRRPEPEEAAPRGNDRETTD